MDIQQTRTSFTVTHDHLVETIAIPDSKLKVFRHTLSVTGNETPSIVQGIATDDEIKSVIATGEYPETSHYVVTGAAKETLLRFGYYGVAIKNYENFSNEKVFDHIEAGGSFDDIVGFQSYDHSFYTVVGELLPVGLKFDYIDGGYHNGDYRLDELVAILRARGDVTFIDDENYDLNELGAGEEILHIPDYNAEKGKNQYVAFFWTPTLDQLRVIRAAPALERYKAVFDNDYLGLRAGGAAKFKDFWGREPIVREKN